MLIATLFPIAKIWKQPKCPSTDEWVKKMWCIYTYTHIYILFSHKKNKVLPFATTRMDLEDIILCEICQTEKDKYYMTPLICGI